MIGTSIDKAAAASPAFEKRFKARIDTLYRTSTAGEIGIFMAASAAAGISASFGNDFMYILSLTAAIAVWIQTAFTAGFLRNWLFAGFLLIYFWLPGLFIIPADMADPQAQRDLGSLLSDLSEMIWSAPALRLMPDEDITTMMLITAAAEMAVFFTGSRIRAAVKRSAVYCRIRLKQLEKE